MLPSRLLQIAPVLALGLSLQGYAAPTVQVLNSNLTQAEVVAAQKGWCDALLKISAAYASGGFSKAKATAEALGLKRVQLLRIDQRGGGPIRPMPYAMAARSSFNPDEARPPDFHPGNPKLDLPRRIWSKMPTMFANRLGARLSRFLP